MNSLHGTIKNGQIVLDVPAALPEGMRVEVLPIEQARVASGMREEDWPTTPEGISALLERMDQVEPDWLSPEDDAFLASGAACATRVREGPLRRECKSTAARLPVTRVLLDTGCAGDYVHSRRGVYEKARAAIGAGLRVVIGLPVLAELWYGVENSSSRERNALRLRRVLPELIVWPLTSAASEEFGRIAAELRRIGRPIGTIDMLIAAIALSLGNTRVISADDDLAAVPGLKVENWSI